ncbi:MAG: hypothetical protein JWQ09_2182, partial [Segetibacter sp.]|nr:hypothetical protein [Segetibacter sp.]
MNRSPEKVLNYLAGNENIDAVTVDDLQKLAAENPYFPVSQFLLAKKLKDKNEPEYLLQVQKTAVYFSNPYWLQYQLTGGHLREDPNHKLPGNVTIEDKAEESFAKAEASIIEEYHPVTTLFSSNELTAASKLAHETIQEIPEINAVDVNNEKDENTNSPDNVETIDDEETAHLNISQAEEEMSAITRNTDEKTESFISHLDTKQVTTVPVTASIAKDLPPAAETEVIELEEEMAGVPHVLDKTTEHFLKDLQPGREKKDELPQDDEHDRMFRNIKAMLDASSEEADADTKNAVISIDPYYTIDYFASQGIKLELDQNPQDQLGQNLKKFTQWLKHMKKLGPEDATEAISRAESEAD